MVKINRIDLLKNVLKDEDRKPLYRILKELIHCSLIEKEIPYYYFTSFLHKKGADDYRNYIGFKKISEISKSYFNVGDVDKLKNKLLFGKILESSGVNTPKILAHNEGSTLHFDDKSYNISDLDGLNGFINLIKNILDRSSSQSIFIKPMDGIGGDDSFKFTNSIEDNNPKAVDFLGLISRKNFIFQETINQHKKINGIYEKSINTVRVHTFFDRERNQVEIISALMRFGAGGSVVDNGSSGGFFIPVNEKTWTLKGVGRTYLNNGGETFERHPNSNVKLDGFVIPYGNKIEQELVRAAKIFDNDFIGWDVAITNDGPLIIEGNQDPHLTMAQVSTGGIKNHPGFKKVFEKYI